MKRSTPTHCSVCGSLFSEILDFGGRRRSQCRTCGHSERIDIESFDYSAFGMGSTGATQERLRAQAGFVNRYLPSSARVLELGCAAGSLARALRERHQFERYDGVEISPSRLEAMKVLDHVFDKPLAELAQQGAIQPRSYNFAVASHFLEHLDDPGAAIDTLLGVLSDDGAIFIEVPNRSGNALLPLDDNLSHIHFFSVSSLSRLLIDRGLQIAAAETGAKLDARYSDSLRVVARRDAPLADFATVLSDHPALAGAGEIVIWGAGGMTDELLAHYFDPTRIAYFVDRDASKHGSTRLGAKVCCPDALKSDPNRLVLINSIEMEPLIRRQIDAEYADLGLQVIGVGSLLEPTDPAPA